MERKYELYINGTLAKRCLTFGGAQKVLAKFPTAKAEIYRVTPTIDMQLVHQQPAKVL